MVDMAHLLCHNGEMLGISHGWKWGFSPMFKITEISGLTRRIVADGFADAKSAEAFVGPGRIMVLEEDSDNPGFFDIFTIDGRVLAIEPVAGEAI